MMRLYSYYRSSCSWRVRIALLHKQLPFEIVPVALDTGEQHGAAQLARSPLGYVPALEVDADGGTAVLAESLAILEYLEERFPEAPLLPKDHFRRARARELALLIVSATQPFQNLHVQRYLKHELAADEQRFTQHFIERGLAALRRRAAETRGTFLVGDAPSLADVCLVPQLYSARRFGVDITAFRDLLDIEQRCTELPGWALAHPDAQPDAPSK